MASIEKLQTYTFDFDTEASEDDENEQSSPSTPQFIPRPPIRPPISSRNRSTRAVRAPRRGIARIGESKSDLSAQLPLPTTFEDVSSSNILIPPSDISPNEQLDTHAQQENIVFAHDVSSQVMIINDAHEEEAPEEPIQKTEEAQPKKSAHQRKRKTIYGVRKTKSGISRLSSYFYLLKSDEKIFSAKYRGISPSRIVINEGPDVHMSDISFTAVLLVSHMRKLYSLRRGNDEGEEIMRIEVIPKTEPIQYQRFFSITIGRSEKVLQLQSMMPTKKADGTYTLKFGPKCTRKSIKNAIIVDHNQSQVFSIRRVADEDLEIETEASLEPLFLFAFGITSWICPF